MTKKRWNKIIDLFNMGDPLKDIGVDEKELIDYIIKLQKEVKRLEEFEWKYKELNK
jgi:hypothetical protein